MRSCTHKDTRWCQYESEWKPDWRATQCHIIMSLRIVAMTLTWGTVAGRLQDYCDMRGLLAPGRSRKSHVGVAVAMTLLRRQLGKQPRKHQRREIGRWLSARHRANWDRFKRRFFNWLGAASHMTASCDVLCECQKYSSTSDCDSNKETLSCRAKRQVKAMLCDANGRRRTKATMQIVLCSGIGNEPVVIMTGMMPSSGWSQGECDIQ